MNKRDSRHWKLLAEIGVVALLAAYYWYARDRNAALAVTLGLLVVSAHWIAAALRNYRGDRHPEKDNTAANDSKNRLDTDK